MTLEVPTDPSTLEVGAALPPRTFGPVTLTDIVRYQGASGDMNPLHHDEAVAKAAGFPTFFSVGMLQAGLLSTYATDLFGAENVRRFGTRFKEQVWAGDMLTCSGTVQSVTDVDGERRVELKLVCTRQTGGVAIDGSATFVVP